MSEVASVVPAAPAAPEVPVAPTGSRPPSAPAPAAQAESESNPAQNSAEQAPAAEKPNGDKTATDQDPEAKRGQRRFERRLDKAYRRAAEAEARARLAEERLAKIDQPKQADPGAPKLENYKDIEEYAEAKAKYESERVLKDHAAKQHAETQKQAQARLSESWEEKSSRGEEKYEDFGEIVGDIKPTTPWAMALMEAENGEEIAYHLGKNLKEAQRIASLPPLAQVREIGKLEAKLLAEPKKPQTPSKAPPPIAPLSGANPPANDQPSESDGMKDWMKKRQAQVHGKRR